MATLQGKAVKNTYRQVLQIGANNVGVSGTLQPVQDGAGVNTALSLSTLAATVNGDLTITGDLIITGGGIQIKDLIDDTVAALIQNGTGITWTYNDGAATLTGNFTGTTSVVPEGSNLYYTQGRFDSAFAAKSTTNLAEGTNLYFTEARGNANFATNLAASDTDDLDEGVTNLYFSNSRARLALSVTAGTGISYNNTTGVFNLAAIPNASLSNSSITINSQSVALGGSVTLTTTNIAEGTNLYWTDARFDSRFGTKTTTNLAEGTNLYYTQARFNSALAAKTTTDLAEGTNLYYTDARARLALSSSATGLSYANNSGVFSLTAGYAIPTTVKLGQYDIAYNRSIVSAAVTGTSTKTLSLTQQDANVITATWTDQGITTINGTANQIAATTVGNTTTIGFTNDVTMPNNLVVSGNLTINGTATYVNTESISSKDPLFEVANTNNTTDAVDIGYYGRYYDAIQERVEFTGLFRDASDAGKFKIFTGLVDEPTNVVNTTGTGYTVATLVANVDGNLNGTANAANILSTARTIAASGDATWSVSFNGSANVSSALTLANTGVTATTYGTSTAVPTIAVDSKGRITSASNTNITFPVTTVNGQAGTVVLTTSDVAEGSNQYFTTARAQAAISGTAPISVASGVVSITQSSAINNGFLSSTDWNTFNNKLSTATAASTYVPYTGATGNVNLGTFSLAAGIGSFSSSGSEGTFAINHTSGSGVGLTITKGGNGEALVINKTSGSGNAATIVGNLSGTSATFSSTLGVTGALSGTSILLTSASNALTLSNASNVWLRVQRGTSFTNIGVDTVGSFYNTNTNHTFYVSDGTITALNLASTGDATISGTLRVNGNTDPNSAAGAFFWNQPFLGPTISGYNFEVRTGNTGSQARRLFISETGAATFSSSVTAGGRIFTSASINDNIIEVSNNDTTNGYGLFVRGGGTASARYAARFKNGADSDVMWIGNTGNVGMGTTTPSAIKPTTTFGWASNLPSRALEIAPPGSSASGANAGLFLRSSDAANGFDLWADNFFGDGYLDVRGDSGFIFRARTNGTAVERMRITSGGGVEITQNNGGQPLIYAKQTGTSGFTAIQFTGNNGADVGSLSTFSGSIYFGRWNGGNGSNGEIQINSSGVVVIPGALSKGSGSFRIDHPLKSMSETHDLVHSFVESPQANNIYRGKVELKNGISQVNLDEVSTMTEGTFVALNREIHTYTSNETDWDAVRGKVEGNILTIECQNNQSNAMVSWLVIGERQDKHMMNTTWTDENGRVIVEPLKPIQEKIEELEAK
jgi:hypothetical protein